jgi:chromate transporter
MQFACICGAAAVSTFLVQQPISAVSPVSVISKHTSIVLLTLFGVLCLASLLIASPLSILFQTGALVFGGGHVMLPLLQARLVSEGYLSTVALLQGYASVQIVPGPLFSIGAYVGGITMGGSVAAALAGLVAIFLPGWLLIMGVMPWWSAIQSHPRVQRGLAGIQAAVVGILAATLIDPILLAAIQQRHDTAVWMLGSTLLIVVRWPAWMVTLLVVLGSIGVQALV